MQKISKCYDNILNLYKFIFTRLIYFTRQGKFMATPKVGVLLYIIIIIIFLWIIYIIIIIIIGPVG